MMSLTANLVEDAQADSASSWGNREVSQAPDRGPLSVQALRELGDSRRPRRYSDPRPMEARESDLHTNISK